MTDLSTTVTGSASGRAILEAPAVSIASSPAEAIEMFGDGGDVAVVGGGTIVVPSIALGRAHPTRVLMLHAAGLDGIADRDALAFGATVTLARLAAVAPEPLASAAAGVADLEVRAQATVGGNLCAGGDVQPALVALGARVRSAGRGGEHVESVEDFLEADEPRLVLGVELDRPDAGAYLAQRRRHAHTYAVLSVAVARVRGAVRVAVGGVAERAVRCRSVEAALADGAAVRAAAERAVDDAQPRDDALGSAWYRTRVLPVLVARALERLAETR